MKKTNYKKIVTPTKEKNETKLLQKINLSVISSLLNGGVKAPRRALGYFTIITFYGYNGYPILLEFVFSSVSQRSFTRG